jgi:hypothetical protein
LPKATRVRFGRCAIVRFRFAAAAAFLTFRRATAFCAAVIQWLFGSGIRCGFGVFPTAAIYDHRTFFSRTNGMRGATDYDDERALKSPVNQVVAVVSPETDLQKVISALHSAGFPEDSIGVLRGQKDAHKLDPASGRHGWLARLAKIGPDFGDLDEKYLKGYADALRAGSTVIAVVAEPGSKRREVADLLKRFGASHVNSYGMFIIEALG